MRMPLEEVTRRTRTIAREFSSSLDVTRVVANDGESDHVELLLTISGCHAEPCAIMVNLPRDPQTFDAELRSRIHEALAAHSLARTGSSRAGD